MEYVSKNVTKLIMNALNVGISGEGMGINQSTFNQRRALHNMHTALGWDVRGIRDMTFDQASAAIKKAQEEIDKNGFPNKNQEE